MARLFVKPASKGLHRHHYEPQTITSLDYGQYVVTRVIECVNGDSFDSIKGDVAVLLQPQDFPPYGKSYVKSAAFFVPEYQLYEDSEAFHTNQKLYKGKATKLPSFDSYDISMLFYRSLFSTQVADVVAGGTPPTYDSYDFSYPINTGTPYTMRYRKLTPLGRYYYKVLKSLGYDFPSYSLSNSFTSAKATGNYRLSALKLLAFAKIYTDYFLSGQAYNSSLLVALLDHIRAKEDYVVSGTTYYTASTGTLSADAIQLILGVYLPHEQNMYLQAWNSLNSPDGLNPSTQSLDQLGSSMMGPRLQNSESISSDSSKNFYTNSNTGTNTVLSANGMRVFKAFDYLVRRFHLAGTKPVQRLYAQFGLKPGDFKSHFAHKLFETSNKIDFRPVVSNSDTLSASGGASLGDYAGWGATGLNVDFNYKCDDYGLIIVLSWLQVAPIIVRGQDPSSLRQTPFDFYTSQYDGNAMRAIPNCEISVNKVGNDDETVFATGDKQIFGFTNIYDDMRTMRDSVSGEFIFGLAKNYLFSRDYSKIREAQTSPMHPQTDVIKYWDHSGNNEMSDPFQLKAVNGDRFYLNIEWSIDAQRPILSDSLAVDLEGGEGDLQLVKNGDMMQ